MTGWIGDVAIADLTPSVLLGIVVMLVLLGKLVPRSILQDKIDEAEKWRLAFETEREARATSDAQTTKLLEVTGITNDALQSLNKSIEKLQRSPGGANAVSSPPY